MKNAFIGLVFLAIGVLIFLYEYKKRQKVKNYRAKFYNDSRGIIAGFVSILFGLYLIFKSLNHLIF